jgi:hypothetical protein
MSSATSAHTHQRLAGDTVFVGVATADVVTLAVDVTEPEVVVGVLDEADDDVLGVDDAELDGTELLDAEVVAAAAITAKSASPMRCDTAPMAWTRCAPTGISAVTGNVIVTTPFELARMPGTFTGAEKTVTVTSSPGVKPLNTTVCWSPSRAWVSATLSGPTCAGAVLRVEVADDRELVVAAGDELVDPLDREVVESSAAAKPTCTPGDVPDSVVGAATATPDTALAVTTTPASAAPSRALATRDLINTVPLCGRRSGQRRARGRPR